MFSNTLIVQLQNILLNGKNVSIMKLGKQIH